MLEEEEERRLCWLAFVPEVRPLVRLLPLRLPLRCFEEERGRGGRAVWVRKLTLPPSSDCLRTSKGVGLAF